MNTADFRSLTASEIDFVAGAGCPVCCPTPAPTPTSAFSITVGGPSATVSQTATGGAGGYATANTGACSWNVLSGNAIGGSGGNATNISKVVQVETVHIL